MNLLSPSNSSFYMDDKITNLLKSLLKSAKQTKSAIEFFKTVVAKNKIDLINENIFILIDLIIELDKKVFNIIPELLSNQEKYSVHKLLRTEMYVRLASLVKFGDRLLILSIEYEQQEMANQNLVYNYLIEVIEDYVDEVKRTVNLSSEFQGDCEDCASPTIIQQITFDDCKPNYSINPSLSWCDDEHDINLLKRRGFIRDSNKSYDSKTDSKESEYSHDLDIESTEPSETSNILISDPDVDIIILESWKQFVTLRSHDYSSSTLSRVTFRPLSTLPSKGKEIVFGSSYTIGKTCTQAKLNIDDTEVVLRKPDNQENLAFAGQICPENRKLIPNQPNGVNFIEFESVEEYLWMATNENDKSIQGGTVDALIVYACNNKQKDYTDAFITTYKSFIGSRELVEKLIHRFEYFMMKEPENADHYRIAKKTFALLLIIVSELINSDLNIYFIEFLIECTYRIISLTEIKLGRIFRQYVIVQIFKFKNLAKIDEQTIFKDLCPSHATCYASIIDIKPEILAQQICLLTSETINNIQPSELLLYIDKQDIEIAPNFSALARLYNSISFWAATTILKENEAKTRLRLIFYFIRVMQKLLEYENYESCSALNSTFCNVSVYRLMPDIKQLDEFNDLFDPMTNYKVYRERLNCVKGTCIPIFFLLIRDIIHIETASPNELHGLINFAKRYQIYNTLKVFSKKRPYSFKKNLPVISFVNNFQDYWEEDKLIEKSYMIKPRGKHEEYENDDDFFTLFSKCIA